MFCWSLRAAAEVKVKVWFPACGDGSFTTILMEAFAEVAGVCCRSKGQLSDLSDSSVAV